MEIKAAAFITTARLLATESTTATAHSPQYDTITQRPTNYIPTLSPSLQSNENSASHDNDGSLVLALVLCLLVFCCVLLISAFIFFFRSPLFRRLRHAAAASWNGDISDPVPCTEEQKRRIEAKQLKRRLWYQTYLSPYTTIVTEENFVYGHDSTGEAKEKGHGDVEDQLTLAESCESASVSNGVTRGSNKQGSAMNDDENDEPTYRTGSTESSLEGTENELGSDEDYRMIKIWDSDAGAWHVAEATCSICRTEYEVGTKVVRSTVRKSKEYCSHVYHLQCILLWLSIGKKRCPICRLRFVPAYVPTCGNIRGQIRTNSREPARNNDGCRQSEVGS